MNNQKSNETNVDNKVVLKSMKNALATAVDDRVASASRPKEND